MVRFTASLYSNVLQTDYLILITVTHSFTTKQRSTPFVSRIMNFIQEVVDNVFTLSAVSNSIDCSLSNNL